MLYALADVLDGRFAQAFVAPVPVAMLDCVEVPPVRLELEVAPLAVYVPLAHVNCITLFTVRTLLALPLPVIVAGAVKYTTAPPAFDVRNVPLIVPGLLSACT